MLRSTNFCEIAEAPLGALGSIMGETLGRGGAREKNAQRPMEETLGREALGKFMRSGDTRPGGAREIYAQRPMAFMVASLALMVASMAPPWRSWSRPWRLWSRPSRLWSRPWALMVASFGAHGRVFGAHGPGSIPSTK